MGKEDPGLMEKTTEAEAEKSGNGSEVIPVGENDGKILLTYYNNNLEVRGDFLPAADDGAPISGDYIRTTLEVANIVYGVQHDEIHKAYTECLDGRIVRDVLIARGDPPSYEIPEYMQFNPYLEQTNRQGDENAAAVDHRARSPFIIVRKGQALAKQKHKKDGKEGTDVHGEVIPFEIKQLEGVSGGENTQMEGRFLISCINGQLVKTKGVLSVRNSLVIRGAVDYTTGNIIFPGDVFIGGPVSDGFKIYSGGSITIKQTFDVTDVIAKNDLTVAGGIIGRGQGLVKVGGILRTKFIENCHVACRKKIIVDTGLVNSQVYTMESLEVGEKGRIVGGEIYAFRGIRTGGIGKKTGKAARIHCGIDFTLEQEKEKNNSGMRNLAAKKARLQELMDDPALGAEKRAKVEAFLRKLEEEEQKIQARISELLGMYNPFEDAVVEVIGEIVPGTLIEICQIALFVTEPLKKVRIRLDKPTSKLVTEKM